MIQIKLPKLPWLKARQQRKNFSLRPRGAMTAAAYSAREQLRDGRCIEIRALRPDDEAGMLAAIDRTGTESLRRRFFVTKRGFSPKEKAFFMSIDFVNHVALVAEITTGGRSMIVGGGRYVVVEPSQAELAFVVIDAYQGQGIGTLLMRHLLLIARQSGLAMLTAEVLSDNASMLKVFERFGFCYRPSHDPQTRHLVLKFAEPAAQIITGKTP